MRRAGVAAGGVWLCLALGACGGPAFAVPTAPGAGAGGGGLPQTATPQTPVSIAPGGGGGGGGGGSGGGGGDPASEIVGDWVGPAPGDAGECGVSYGEWFFQSAGSYTFTENSDATANPNTMTAAPADCAGVTVYGVYSLQGNEIQFHQQSDPGCPPCQQSDDFAVTYSFINANDLQMCDTTPGGQCYVYSRQS